MPTAAAVACTKRPVRIPALVTDARRQPSVIARRATSAMSGPGEIVPNERIVSTEVYEGLPEGVSEEEGGTVNTATFTEADGRTTLTILVQAPTKETRDAIIDSGMEAGMQDAMDLLEEVAISLR